MSIENEAHKYDDIIHLKRPVSSNRIRMSLYDRAAQFSAFAALTGFDGVIAEVGRLTDDCIELDESGKEILNDRLQCIMEAIEQHPVITMVCFQPDQRKSGGKYIHITGAVKKIDIYQKAIVLQEGRIVPIREIYEINGDMFL